MDKRKRAVLILLMTASFWGGNFVIGKVVVANVPPFMMSFARWSIALVLLFPLLSRRGLPNLHRIKNHWKFFLAMSISGFFGFNTLVYFAVKHTTSVNAALVNSLTPVVLVILSTILLSEKINLSQIFGILISFIGVLIVISQGTITTFSAFQFNIGDLIMIIAVLLWGGYSIIMKRMTSQMDSLTITTINAVIGWLLLLPFAIGEYFYVDNIQFNVTSILGLLYIGVFASVLAFLGWNEGVIRLGPGKASVFLNLIPVFAAIFSFFFLHEHLLIYQIIGGIIVILGVLITNYRNITSNTEKMKKNIYKV